MAASILPTTLRETHDLRPKGLLSRFRYIYALSLTSASDTSSELESLDLQEVQLESYPKGWKLACVLLSGIIPYMVVVLDDTVLAPIISLLVNEFQRPTDIGWYASSYFITLTVLMPIYGKCYTLWQVRQVFIVALVLLTAGSIVSAAAKISMVFILGRAIAGTGAAGVITGATRIITLSAPRERRPYFEALGAVIVGVCSASGPLLGGVIAEYIGWRWSFWINAPVAIFSIGIILSLFPQEKSHYVELHFLQKIRLLDLFGAAILAASLSCLICGLQIASESVWSCLQVILLLSLAVLFVIIFVLHETFAGAVALIPRQLLGFKIIWIPCLGLFFLYAGFIHFVFFLSLYFQTIQGCSSQESAIRLLPYVLSMSLTAMTTVIGVRKVKFYNPFIIGGGILLSVGACLFNFRFDINADMKTWIWYESLLGAGMGFCVMSNLIPCQTILEERYHSISYGLTFLFSMLGASVSIPISTSIFYESLRSQITSMELPTEIIFVILQQPSRVRRFVPLEFLPYVLEGIMKAILKSFIFGLACFNASLVILVFLPWIPISGTKG